MSHSTPFFQGFSSLLFGRPALSDLEKLLRKVASLRSLSDFFQTFGFLVPEVLLERRPKGESSRQRRFSLHVTFWAFLAQVLVPQTSCRDIVRKVQAWWMLRDPKAKPGSSSTAAYMRLHHARKPRQPDFRKGTRLGPDERLITWAKPAKCPKGVSEDDFAQLPDSLTLRHVRLRVSARGHRTQTVWLVTSLLDTSAYPIDSLGELYFQRWGVELHFREIKITLGMDVLRCQSPDMVEKEVFMHSIACNLVRSLMQKAAIDHCVNLSRISFKGTADTLRHWSSSMEALRGRPSKQKALLSAMLEIIAKDLVPRKRPAARNPAPENAARKINTSSQNPVAT